jgi:hypothetical protein
MRFLTEDEKDAEFHRTRWPRNNTWELATFGNHIGDARAAVLRLPSLRSRFGAGLHRRARADPR